ncbi:MAG: UvrD-helicase domain-containing protein [Clostridia bacterium]|nr:UvrD-helicase domain-containing protein [Clostridia bacterium]
MTEERIWTPAQKRAIGASGDTVVCAAAGSGKTAVLTENILRYLTDGEHPGTVSRVLAVTFTRAAAAQLKSRLRAELEKRLEADPDNEHLARQLLLLPSASISTIDSFYQDLLRSEKDRIGLPASLRLTDSAETDPLLDETLLSEEALRFEKNDADFIALVGVFADFRGEGRFLPAMRSLYTALRTLPEGCSRLTRFAEEAEAADGELFQTEAGRVLSDALASDCRLWRARFERALETMEKDHPYRPAAEAEAAFLTTFESALSESYATAAAALRSRAAVPLGSKRKGFDPELRALFKTFIDGYRDAIKKIGLRYFAQTGEEARETIRRGTALLRALADFLSAVEARMEKAKREKGICDFSDVSHYVLRILYREDGTLSDTARSIAACYDRIYIDEYQDVNPMQKKIFDALSRQNRFIVGDVKQSIYAFRGSDPSILDSLRREAADPGRGISSVFMAENFRSSETILDFANAAVAPLFAGGSFLYTKEDELVFGGAAGVPERGSAAPVTVLLRPDADPPKNEKQRRQEEARAVCDEIERLVREEKKADGSPFTCGDVAVLFRRDIQAAALTRELDARALPYTTQKPKDLFESPHVSLAVSLLEAVDNPLRDIPLASVLLSPLFSFSADEFFRLSQTKRPTLWEKLCARSGEESPLGEKAKRAADTVNALRERARRTPTSDLVRSLFFDSGTRAALAAASDAPPAAVSADLGALYRLACSYPADAGKGLGGFTEYLEREKASGLSRALSLPDENSVRLMTIHGSKGLEFPAVFLIGCGKDPDPKESSVFSYSLSAGAATAVPDVRGFLKIENPLRQALSFAQKRQSSEEEKRLLYVALTRARERLCLSAPTTEKIREKAKTERFFAPIPCPGLFESRILYAVTAALACPDLARILVGSGEEAEETLRPAAEAPAPVRIPDAGLEEKLINRLAFSYPDAFLTRIPAKLSVSELSPSVLDEASPLLPDPEGSDPVLRPDQTALAFEDAPAFLLGEKKVGAAEAGTATHQFLQFCRFERAENTGAAEEGKRLFADGFLTERQLGALRVGELDAFFASPFYARLKAGRDLRREFRFNCFLPARMLTTDPALKTSLGGRELAVQGVIDGFFLEGEDVILFDYKTDRLPAGISEEEALSLFSERYAWQLSCYAAALRRIYGKPVADALIYSTALGRAFSLRERLTEA